MWCCRLGRRCDGDGRWCGYSACSYAFPIGFLGVGGEYRIIPRAFFPFYIFTFLHFYIFTFLHFYIFTFLHFYIFTFLHFYIFTFLHFYIFTFLHFYIFTFLHFYIFTFLHFYIFTFLHFQVGKRMMMKIVYNINNPPFHMLFPIHRPL